MVKSATAAATAGAVATAAIGIRCRHSVGRNRHGSDSANQLGSLSVLSSCDIVILLGLADAELQRLILSLQAGNLVLSEEGQDGSNTGVLVLHDVTGHAVNGVAQTAQAGGHVVLDAVNAALSFAAALSQLALDAVKAGQ